MRPPQPARRLVIFALGLLSALLLFAPHSAVQAAHRHHVWHVTVGVDSADNAIMDMAFLPGDLYIDTGDTVIWTARSQDYHTVTFLKRGTRRPLFDWLDFSQATQTGDTRYDGVSYNNSGLMTESLRPGPATTDTYSLTFVKAGTFTYICLLHRGMKARIHVRPAGTPYPFTQAQYDAAARRQVAAAMRDGHALAARARRESSNHDVTLGIGDDRVSVMRFFPPHIVVHVGDTVTITTRDAMDTHTVAANFESDPSERVGDPTSFDGFSTLNSGYLGMKPQFLGKYYGMSYRVKFVAAGSYEISCALHDDLGMKATVDVQR